MTIRPDPTGWTVAVTHPQTGRVHTPAVVGSPSRAPTANDLPSVAIPVASDDKWLHPDWEDGAAMRVWVDGQRQPLDYLETVSHTQDTTTLHAAGGHQLHGRVKRGVEQRTTHGLVETLIHNRTEYDPVVTAPAENRTNGVGIADWRGADTLAEHCPAVADPREPITRTDDGTGLETQQIAYPKDPLADDVLANIVAGRRSGPQFSGGVAGTLTDETGRFRFVFSPDHDIPASDVGLSVRDQATAYSNVRYSWAGTRIDEQHNAATDLKWRGMGQGGAYGRGGGYAATVGTGLQAGQEYAFDIEVLDGGAGYIVDLVALYDRRFGSELEFPNPGDGNGGRTLRGPAAYPSSYRVRFSPAEPIRSVVAGRAVVTGRGGGSAASDPEQNRVYLSADQASTYARATGDDVSFDFDVTGPGPSLTTIVALGRQGDDPQRGHAPAEGYYPQRITRLRLEADLVDTPITVDRSFDAPLKDVLTTLANESNSLWEYRRAGDTQQVVWTQPGRSPVPRSHAPDAASFALDKTTGTTVETAVVYGGTRQVTGERVGASLDTAASLAHDRLQKGSVSVVNATGGTRYTAGDDYTVEHEQGRITPTSDGRIGDGDTLAVSYRYQTRGEYTAPIAGPTKTVVEDIAGLNSGYAATQAARTIVTERQREQISGQLVIPATDTGFTVVEYLRPEELPIGEGGRRGTVAGLSALQIRGIETTPTETTLRLGNRRSVAQIVSDISHRVAAVSRQA